MITLDVLDTFPIRGDTMVVVKGDRSLLRNGIEVSDGKGNLYKILSVGLLSNNTDKSISPLLIEGSFLSDKIYIKDSKVSICLQSEMDYDDAMHILADCGVPFAPDGTPLGIGWDD